jgi:hypothetical protein
VLNFSSYHIGFLLKNKISKFQTNIRNVTRS